MTKAETKEYHDLCNVIESLNDEYHLDIAFDCSPHALCRQLIDQLKLALDENEKCKHTIEDRYRLIATLMDDVMFEYHLKNQTMSDSNDWNNLADGQRFLNGSIHKGIIHPEDVQNFLQFFSGTNTMQTIHEIMIRIRLHANEEYTWNAIRGIILPDIHGQPEKIIGIRTPVDRYKQEMDHLRSKAQLDGLTNLYNKITTQQLSEQFLHTSKQIAFFMFDIDDFKTINDRYGHIIGDETLKAMAARLQPFFNANSIIGRIGGDEFLAVVPWETMEDVIAMAEALHSAFQDIHLGQLDLQLTSSIGIALSPKDGHTFMTLLDKADKALYTAKKQGKNTYCFF